MGDCPALMQLIERLTMPHNVSHIERIAMNRLTVRGFDE